MNTITRSLRQTILKTPHPAPLTCTRTRTLLRTASTSTRLPEIELGPTHPSRYQDHYHNTLTDDLLYMTYDHNHAPSPGSKMDLTNGTGKWETDLNPYELNRPASPPRGNRPLKPRTPLPSTSTIPKLESIVIHTMIKESIGHKPSLLPAIMALRSISGETHQGGGRRGSSGVQIISSKSGAAAFKLRAGMPVAVKVELKGQGMYDFIQSLVDFVLPRLREFPGVPLPAQSANKNSPSATSGVVAFGLDGQAMGLFPQIETNLESYPRLHGFHLQFVTNCKGKGAQDQARALLSGMRIPFTRR